MVMSLTVPTVTPRNLTGEPTSRPCTDSSKSLIAGNDSRRNRRAPSQKSVPSIAPTASRTKSPSFQWLVAVVAISRGPGPRIEEGSDRRIGASVAERRGLSARDDAARSAVQQDAVSDDREDAPQLVRDHDRRHAEADIQGRDEIVEFGGGDRIEARRPLVEEQQRGVEGERAGDPSALLHPARDLRRKVVLETLESHQTELRADDRVDRVAVELGPLREREGDILRERHRAEERSRLEEDAVAWGSLAPRGCAGDADRAAQGFLETDQCAEQGRLPAPAPAQDGEHVAAGHREVEVLEHHRVAVAERQALDLDHGRLSGRGH